MQLEMYKKQYRDLLQEKVILESFQGEDSVGRKLKSEIVEPQYEIVSREERSSSSYQT